jgi:exodeoxyribonuclease VII small subunit
MTQTSTAPPPSAAARPADIAALSFETAIAELEQIVRQLEAGKDSLETAIAAYARGVQLKDHCEAKLKEARDRIEKISRDSSGALKSEAFGSSGKSEAF